MKNYDWLVEMATGILDMAEENEALRMRVAKLEQYEAMYHEQIEQGIAHSHHMLGGILSLAMTPGVMEAIGKANKAEVTHG